MTFFVRKRLLLSACAASAIAGPALAADPQEPAAKQQGDGEISLRSDIVVTGRAGKTANIGGLGARAIVDIPFSVTAVSEKDISDRMAKGIDQILKGDAAARTSSNATAGIISYVTVRGLLLDPLNAYKIDGLAYPSRTDLPAEHFQQVELLKGLSGFMYGFGSPGGIINYVSKQPLAQPMLNLQAGFNSDDDFQIMADASQRFGREGMFGVRAVGVNEEGATYVDGGHIKRQSVSVAADAQLTKSLRISLDGLYQQRDTQGVIFGIYLPATAATRIDTIASVDGRTNPSETGSFYNSSTKIATARADYDLSSDWKLDLSYRFSQIDAAYREGNINITDQAGDYKITESVSPQRHRFQEAQLLGLGKFDTGPFTHQITYGASWQFLQQYNDAVPGSHILKGISNFYDPIALTGSGDDPSTHYTNIAVSYRQEALFGSDTVSIGKFSVLVGVRYNKFKQINYAFLKSAKNVGAKTATYTAKPLTPTIALRFQPAANTTLYASYVQSLEQGGQASVINANYGTIYGPLKSKQYEVGFKVTRHTLDFEGAVFRIDRGATYTNADNIFVQDGVSRYQGLEGSVTVRPFRGFSVKGGGMYEDAKYEKATPSIVGNRVPGTPKWSASLEASYDVPQLPGFRVLTNVNYVGRAWLQTVNLNTVPGFVAVDLAARYRFPTTPALTLTVAVKNVGGRDFWTIYNSGTPALLPGAPRTVSASIGVQF